MKPSFKEEKALWKKGYKYVIGVDEVGRGAFAGPVTVAAVVFECETDELNGLGINDSKLLKSRERRKLSKLIQEGCMHYSVATIGVPTINKVGIGKATSVAFRKAIKEAIEKLSNKVVEANSEFLIMNSKFFLLVDGFHIKFVRGIGIKNQKAIVKGDRKSISIAAASILAKVHRDSLMKRLSKKYPEYGFGKNKGYGTAFHRKAIKKHGLSRLHRTSSHLEKFG